MTTSQETTFVQVYFIIPFTKIKTTCLINYHLSINEFLEYVNTNVRNKLNINPRYDIELVYTGDQGETIDVYKKHLHNKHLTISFDAQPVNPVTREFIRLDDYSV